MSTKKTLDSVFEDPDFIAAAIGRRYRGRSKATMDLLEACKAIIDATAPITVRGVCYRLFVAKRIDSMATKNTQKISRLLTWAREEDEIDWDDIVDESRSMDEWAQYKDLEAFGEHIATLYSRDFWAHQKFALIVISEKATVAGILRPVLQEYGIPFFAVHGFNSATKVHDLADAIKRDERITVLLYIGDWDCSGMYMSEEDLPKRLKEYGASGFVFTRLAISRDDTATLPSFPAEDKKKDPRYRWFVSRYGARCWELDAMNPNDLRARVETAVKKLFNPEDWKRHKEIEKAQRETTKKIAKAMADAGAN